MRREIYLAPSFRQSIGIPSPLHTARSDHGTYYDLFSADIDHTMQVIGGSQTRYLSIITAGTGHGAFVGGMTSQSVLDLNDINANILGPLDKS